MLDKIINIDKRVIFILLALVVIIPMLLKLKFPISVSAPTQNVYDYIEALPPGATVMISFDYGPSSKPEPTAIAKTVLRHCFRKGVKVIGMTLIPPGVLLADTTLKEVAREEGAVEREDYVYFGFRPGEVLVIIGIGDDIADIFKTDYTGTPLTEIPMMQQITNYNQIDLLLVLAAGNTVESWITYAQTNYNVPIAAGTTGVITTQLYPYLQTGQLIGLLNGYVGAGEYETLMGYVGDGTLGISAAVGAHLLIIGLVIIGNIVYFIQQRREKNRLTHAEI